MESALDGFSLQPPTSAIDILMTDFCDWWRNLPTDMKKGKANAWKCYQKARRKVTAEEIVDGTERYIRHKPAWQHFAHASTFLNQERWEDQYETERVREECPHTPRCQNATNCANLIAIARFKAEKYGLTSGR